MLPEITILSLTFDLSLDKINIDQIPTNKMNKSSSNKTTDVALHQNRTITNIETSYYFTINFTEKTSFQDKTTYDTEINSVTYHAYNQTTAFTDLDSVASSSLNFNFTHIDSTSSKKMTSFQFSSKIESTKSETHNNIISLAEISDFRKNYRDTTITYSEKSL